MGSLAKMKEKGLSELARVLESMEVEFRSSLTIPLVVRWLAWKKGVGSTSHRVFSPLSDKVRIIHSCCRILFVELIVRDSDRHMGNRLVSTGLY